MYMVLIGFVAYFYGYGICEDLELITATQCFHWFWRFSELKICSNFEIVLMPRVFLNIVYSFSRVARNNLLAPAYPRVLIPILASKVLKDISISFDEVVVFGSFDSREGFSCAPSGSVSGPGQRKAYSSVSKFVLMLIFILAVWIHSLVSISSNPAALCSTPKPLTVSLGFNMGSLLTPHQQGEIFYY